MAATAAFTDKQKYTFPFQWLIIAIGAAISLFSVYHLPLAQIDVRFLLLAAMTVVISSRVGIKVPRINSDVSISDTFIFVAILLYNSHIAILLAAAEGLCSGVRISKKPRTVLFNSAVSTCATAVTVQTLNLAFGSPAGILHHSFSIIIIAVCAMALVHYFSYTSIIVTAMSCKENQPFWQMWSRNFLWVSVTHFVGAMAAAIIAGGINVVGFYAVLVVIPIISILYFTYYKYLEDIRAAAAQAEHSERARAELERARAEQAERHVEELSRYIAEQERIGRELEESREHFRHAAFHDTLTNLPNRALLTEHLKRSIESAKQSDNHLFALLFLDLDRFKNINDSLGHVAGDQLLISIARRLEGCLRPADTVARLGGDEFAILLNGLDDYSDAVRVAERAQQELSRPLTLNGHEVYTTASIGITINAIGYDDPESILRDADTAMYRAKENGKARHEMFDQLMHARAVSRLQLENDLRRALERQEFRVYYQPIIALETNGIAGFEALVRWEHPVRGFIAPIEFISVAEETGLITALGEWVLREACRQTREWQTRVPGCGALSISVNLSGKQFAQPDLIEKTKAILYETKLDPCALKLEITESVVMENAEIASTMLTQLRALGAELSIDDFGTGYSSLSYLHRFPVNTLKIDRSFISRMGEEGENTEIVRTILTLASNLGMDVVAEGIETTSHLTQLKEMKCEYGQGYLFSKPVSAANAEIFLRAAKRAEASILEEEAAFDTSSINFSYIN
ncbi:MAG: putative bifunctional diguanylate cyclase/phosphodiesterase [Pyrinomonadaceae bacterium]